jgi:choice-of-anchor B domain-containing protein
MPHQRRSGAILLSLALAAAPAGAQDLGAQHGGLDDSRLIDLPRLSYTPCQGGQADIYPCAGIDLLSFVPGKELAPGAEPHVVSDVWGWTDPETGREYALVTLDTGTSFVDVTNPEVPTVVGYLPGRGDATAERDVKVHANHALVVAEAFDAGIQVLDLTRLRDVTAPPVTLAETAHYVAEGLSWSRNIAVDAASGFAYVAGSNTCAGGLHAVDVSNPAQPAFAGCVGQDGFIQDAQCSSYAGPDAEHQGRQVCFAFAEDTLTILDVTDKSAPQVLARESYPGVGYTFQGWTTEDQLYLLLADSADELLFGHDTRTYLWQVSPLRSPLLLGVHTGSGPAIDHEVLVRGERAYLASYTAGLRVLDIAGIGQAQLREVASFDVVPGDEAPLSIGAWGSYPFFPSGVVAVTAIRQGLFLLDVLE